MKRRILTAAIGTFGISAVFVPSLVDGLMASILPFFLGFGPEFIQRLGATFTVLAVTNEAIATSLDDIQFYVASIAAFVTAGLVTIALAFVGVDVVSDGDLLLVISHILPYLFAVTQTKIQRWSVLAVACVLPPVGYVTLETFDGTPATIEAIVITFVGILFGLPLAALGWTTKRQSQ